MKLTRTIHLIADCLLPLICATIIVIGLFVFTTLNTLEVLEIGLVVLLFFYIIFICFLHKIIQNEKDSGKVDLIADFLVVLSLGFALFVSSIFGTSKMPLRVSYNNIEIKEAMNYYTLTEEYLYNSVYQYQIPQTHTELYLLLDKEIGLDNIKIRYVYMNSDIDGFVKIFDKKSIYVNNEVNETIENAFIITHELMHIRGSVNEAETNFKTTITLLNSSNTFLQWVGAQFAVHTLSNMGDNYYNCSELLIEHYYQIRQKG